MKWHPPTVGSVILALTIAAVAPGLWFITTGSTYTTPTISKADSDKMTDAERDAWIERNKRQEPFFAHVKDVPRYYLTFWAESLQIAIVVFAIVLVAENMRRNLGPHEP